MPAWVSNSAGCGGSILAMSVNGYLCLFVSSASHCPPIHGVLQPHCDPELDQMKEENGMDAHLTEAVLNCFPATELSWKNVGNCSNNGLLLCTVRVLS